MARRVVSPDMDPVVHRQVAVGDAELSVFETGDGPPVVLLHGLPTGAELWRPLLTPLAEAGHHAMAPDLPGYGRTRLPLRSDHSLGASADLVARWLTAEAAGPAWIVGHDTGGAIAQLLAVRAPQLVGRLTLTNSIADGSWPAPRARFAKAAAHLGMYRAVAAMRLVPSPVTDLAIRRAFADASRARQPDVRRLLWDTKVTDRRGRAAFERHLACLHARDTAEAAAGLPAVTVPCQLIWGMADPFQRWLVTGRRLLDLLPDADVTQLDGCGHFTPIECPAGLAVAMLSWQARTA